MRNVGTKGITGVKTTKKLWKETATGIWKETATGIIFLT
jgi:hypothetical protein